MIEINKNYKSLKVNGLFLIICDSISHLQVKVRRDELLELFSFHPETVTV